MNEISRSTLTKLMSERDINYFMDCRGIQGPQNCTVSVDCIDGWCMRLICGLTSGDILSSLNPVHRLNTLQMSSPYYLYEMLNLQAAGRFFGEEKRG